VATAGQDGYDVRHALFREVIDADLLPGERVRLHADLAQALTDRPELADGSPAMAAAERAAHWDAAGDPTRALPARVRAGLAADQAHAFPEAQRHYERALELWSQVLQPASLAGLDRVELLTRAAEAAGFAAQAQRALVLLTEALGQLDPEVDQVRAALLHMRLGDQSWVAGNEPACLAALADAVRLLPSGPSPERARVLAVYAQWLMLAGRYGDAIARAGEALAVARTVGARAEEGHALDILGSCAYDAQQLVEARHILEEIGNGEGIARAYLNLSAVLSFDGREREALDNNRRGLAAARELGMERAMGSYLAADMALNLYYLGDWQESERVIGEALEREATAAPRLHTVKGLLETGRGNYQAARQHLELAMRLSPGSYEGVGTVPGLVELAVWEGRYHAACVAVDDGLAVLAQLGAQHDQPIQQFGLLVGELCALGLRAQADQAELAQAQRAATDVTEARRRASQFLVTLKTATGQQDQTAATTHAWLPSYTAQAQAEYSRLEGQSDPQLWQQTAESWERLQLPYQAAYAHLRERWSSPNAAVSPLQSTSPPPLTLSLHPPRSHHWA